MVLEGSKAYLKAALATFFIGDQDRKSGRSNRGAEVKTTLRPGSVFWSDNGPGLSVTHVRKIFIFERVYTLLTHPLLRHNMLIQCFNFRRRTK